MDSTSSTGTTRLLPLRTCIMSTNRKRAMVIATALLGFSRPLNILPVMVEGSQ